MVEFKTKNFLTFLQCSFQNNILEERTTKKIMFHTGVLCLLLFLTSFPVIVISNHTELPSNEQNKTLSSIVEQIENYPQHDENNLTNFSLAEIAISEFEILEFSGFNGRLQNGHCCSGPKLRSNKNECKNGNSSCEMSWRICITDLEPDPNTGNLLLRETPEVKPRLGGIFSR